MNKTLLLIPHYNNPKGLKKSIQSIGKNEYIDILIVDDGSKKCFNKYEIIAAFVGKGVVIFEYFKENRGIEYALNKGLDIAVKKKYQYIARLDCGDICLPDRFKKQKEFLENNDVVLVGSNVDFVDTKGDFLYTLKMPQKDHVIRKKMFINAMHIHPSIMFKTFILNEIGFYPENYKAAEDYAFFFKVLKKFKVANIPEVMVICELNNKGISILKRKEQAKNRVNIILDNFHLGFYPIYGLFRSLILCLIPHWVLLILKKKLK